MSHPTSITSPMPAPTTNIPTTTPIRLSIVFTFSLLIIGSGGGLSEHGREHITPDACQHVAAADDHAQ